jgi:hypothetical protein
MNTRIAVSPVFAEREDLKQLADTSAKEFGEMDTPLLLTSGEVVEPFDTLVSDWRVVPGRDGAPVLSVTVNDGNWKGLFEFRTSQLENPESRYLTLSEVWRHVLRHRLKLQYDRMKQAVASMTEEN